MKFLNGKIAVVTGAGSGIGRAISVALAEVGAHLILCDVNEVGLQETRDMAAAMTKVVLSQRVDVSDREQMAAFAEEAHRERPAVDILVNNAGIGLGGTIMDTTLEDYDRILGVNLFGVIHGCHFFVPPMVRRGTGGHVVNVSSMLGYHKPPGILAYIASKHGVLGFSEAMRNEVGGHGIGVTTLCPGMINTNIVRTSPIRGVCDPEAKSRRITRMYEKRNYSPERVAEAALHGIRHNASVLPVAPEAWLAYYLERFAPGLAHRLGRLLAKQMQ